MTQTQFPLAMLERLVALDGDQAANDPGSWSNVQIMPDGDVPIAGGEVLQLTAENAERVIEAWREQGVDIPIDIEHHTLDEERDNGAPAVGWIKDLKYTPERGLTASVAWTDKGLGFVKSQEFKYLSPVLLFDDDGELYRLHSVALTNRPAIRFAESLKAASENLGDTKMPKKKSKKAMPLLAQMKKLAEDVPEAMEGEVPVADIAVVAGEIKSMMDIEGDDLSLGALLVAIRDKLKTMVKGTAEGDEDGDDAGDAAGGESAVAATEAIKELGKMMKLTDAAPKAVVTAIREKIAMSTSNAEVKALTDRLAKIEKREVDDKIDVALKAYHESGQINPHDEDDVANWRALAEENFDRFVALADKLPPKVPQGERFPEGEVSGGQRVKVLKDSVAALRLERQTKKVETSERAWHNLSLSESNMLPLTDDEEAKYCRVG